jgi:hypothetical protein
MAAEIPCMTQGEEILRREYYRIITGRLHLHETAAPREKTGYGGPLQSLDILAVMGIVIGSQDVPKRRIVK